MSTTFDGFSTHFGTYFDPTNIVTEAQGISDLPVEQQRVWDALSRNTTVRVFDDLDLLRKFITEHNLTVFRQSVYLGVGDTLTVKTPMGIISYTEHIISQTIKF